MVGVYFLFGIKVDPDVEGLVESGLEQGSENGVVGR